jgi:PAS domain S-box-containing protein
MHSNVASTIERAPVGIAHFDLMGRFTLVNPQLCAIFGLDRDELLTRTFQEISFPEDLSRCLALTAKLSANEIPRYAVEKRFVRPDGSFVYVRVIVSAVRDHTGEVSYFLGIVEDLSEYWAAEQGRREAESRLALALEAAETGIYRYDFQSKSLDWANGLAKVFGFDEREPLQSLDRLLGAIHPDDLPKVLQAYERSATTGDDFHEHFRIVRPDGRVRWIADRANITLEADGRPRYLTGACTDVTALMQARGDAERASQVRDEVMAIVAHDLRNPVHTIMLASGAMADLALSEEENRRHLALIRRSARGMDHLIRDLLDASQIEQGRLAISAALTDIESVVGEAATLSSTKASDAGLSIDTLVDSGVPPVYADRDRILQVLGNLLGNAIKFSSQGCKIRIHATHTDNAVTIAVSDTGCGISDDQLPFVFDRYWQAERKTTKGVGLGLSIVRGIVEAHGGHVSVESALGAGSTFRISLPVSSESRRSSSASSS